MTEIVSYHDPAGPLLQAIRYNGDLSDSTKDAYSGAVRRAAGAGVDFGNATSVLEYAATISDTDASWLRAAIGTWADRKEIEAMDRADGTAQTNTQIQAVVYKLTALKRAIKVNQSTGEQAHIWLTSREVRQLMTSIDTSNRRGRRDRVLLALLMGAGLRRRELVDLRWRDVKTQGERVVLAVKGKGKKNRVVPISPSLAGYLDAWRRETAGADEDRVVRGVARRLSQLTDGITPAQVYNIVKKYGAKIDKPKLAPHDLRRTYAQLGYEAGVPITQLSKLLGHSSVAVTQRYLNIELDLSVTASDFIPV